MDAPLRLSPVQRIDLEEEVMGLVVAAIRTGHPERDHLLTVRLTDFRRMEHGELASWMLRLKAWIAEQDDRRSPAPAAPGGREWA